MKFLVNSKYLHAKVAQAIGNESKEFVTQDRMITFIGDSGNTQIEVETMIGQTMTEKFYTAYWRDVLVFLNQIPEQPITVELNYNSIDIYCVRVFKIAAED